MSAVGLVSQVNGAPLNQKEREAVELLLTCFRERFTGSLKLDFSEGTPTRHARKVVGRFGKSDNRSADT